MRTTVLFLAAMLAGCNLAGCNTEPGTITDEGESHPLSDDWDGAPHFMPRVGWLEREPSSSMRVAEYVLPGTDGAQDATLVVYHFGQTAGSVEANVDRWIGQMSHPDGEGGRGLVLERSSRTTPGGVALHRVDVAGTYVGETSPGSGVLHDDPGQRMVATIFETPTGAYYAKLLGPAETVERWLDDYATFVDVAVP